MSHCLCAAPVSRSTCEDVCVFLFFTIFWVCVWCVYLTTLCVFISETPPPGYLSEDGETSDHQMNHSMDTGSLTDTKDLRTYQRF